MVVMIGAILLVEIVHTDTNEYMVLDTWLIVEAYKVWSFTFWVLFIELLVFFFCTLFNLYTMMFVHESVVNI
jgi:hypothetical protein